MSAEAKTGNQPDQYILSGDGIHVTYSTTSFTGQPQFNYHSAALNKLFIGDDIRTVETELGTLVTVTLNMTPDMGSTTFTLLIPRVKLPASNTTNIVTDGITTLHKTTIAGPPVGQDDFYTTQRLQGTASFVFF